MKTSLVTVLSLLVPTIALADTTSISTDADFDHPVAAASNTLELGVASGYTQGGGKLGGTMGNLEDIAGAGGAVEVSAAYRIIPNLSLGVYGQFSSNQHGDLLNSDTNIFGAAAGIQAVVHARPASSVDPWLSVGGGWRGLWLDPTSGKTTSLQGFDLARVQIGVDYRVSKQVSIAPVVGGNLTMYVSEDSPMTTAYTEIADKKVNLTGFAGLAGRFDL
jgi:hypothetical protein